VTRALLPGLICAAALTLAAQPDRSRTALLLVGGTLIDGTGSPPRTNEAMLVVDGRIKLMGLQAVRKAPKNARIVHGTDRWIVPGFIDGHVHFFQNGGLDARPDVVPLPDAPPYREVVDRIRRMPQVYLRAYVCSGVTAVADFGGPMWGFNLRDSREDDALSPRIAFSGPLLATYDPKALELEADEPIWLMKDQADIGAKVERIAAHSPEFVKVWFVHRQGDDLEAQTALVRTAIETIHAKKLRAAVHATTLETARRAVAAGADILVHGVSDRDVDEEFVRDVVARHVLYVPTLLVSQSYREVRTRSVEFEPFELECAPPESVASFERLPSLPETVLPRPAVPPVSRTAIEQRNLKRLSDAGAIIVAGTDAGNTRTLHGPSLHREFVLMVEAGMTPMQVIVSATGNGARLLGRERELGQLAPGMHADVLVLDADPLADIRNTRRISRIFRGGVEYFR
jgi:imidazolonepropionase-like amidohydrolase